MIQKCKQCEGKGYVRLNFGGLIWDAACLDCDETGYVDVPEDSCEESNDTADADHN